jgi:feruloyl esterase
MSKEKVTLVAAVLFFSTLLLATAATAGPGSTSCTDLKSLTIRNTTVMSATYIPPSGGEPGYCEVMATVEPQTDVAVRLPDEWRERYLHLGGGGFDGTVPDLNFPFAAAGLDPIANGFVVVASNGGHRAGDYPGASFSIDRGLSLSYATGAIYDSDMVGKALVKAYYGKAAKYRYFTGCSNGGKNASDAAGVFTDDYDGVIAGDGSYGHSSDHLGGSDMAGLTAKWLQVAQTVGISAAKGMAIMQAQLAQCDASDGLSDGIISNPEGCDFDPAVLRCSGASNDSCLTDAEIEAVRTIRSDLRDAKGRVIGPPFGLGNPAAAEPVPMTFIQAASTLGGGFLSIAFGNGYPVSPASLFDLDRDFPTLVGLFDNVYSMTGSLDGFTRYLKKGKKLIFWHGWEDMVVPPHVSTRFYSALSEAAGPKAKETVRLYMLPGVGHCGGGAGADTFNLLGVMADWVENGVAPGDDIVASKVDPNTGSVLFTRPMCEYPEIPVYKRGNRNDASSFKCQLRKSRGGHHYEWDYDWDERR